MSGMAEQVQEAHERAKAIREGRARRRILDIFECALHGHLWVTVANRGRVDGEEVMLRAGDITDFCLTCADSVTD